MSFVESEAIVLLPSATQSEKRAIVVGDCTVSRGIGLGGRFAEDVAGCRLLVDAPTPRGRARLYSAVNGNWQLATSSENREPRTANYSSAARLAGGFDELFQVDHQRSRSSELPAARRLVAK